MDGDIEKRYPTMPLKVPTSKIESISLRLNGVDNEEGVFLNRYLSEDIS